MAGDRQSWLDVAWVVPAVLTGTVAWSVAVAWWASSVGGLTYVVWERFIPRGTDPVTLASLLGFGDSRRADVLVITTIGAGRAADPPVRAPRGRAAPLQPGPRPPVRPGRDAGAGPISSSSAGRRPGREAEAGTLRRLERDIHDGPQQRLVRLSMDLGRARKRQVGAIPAARATIDSALRQTQDTLEELRGLFAGHRYPPVLNDRCHAPALRGAGRPVDRADPRTGLALPVERLAHHVETAVYFVASEALANVAKHSGAERCTLTVTAFVDNDL